MTSLEEYRHDMREGKAGEAILAVRRALLTSIRENRVTRTHLAALPYDDLVYIALQIGLQIPTAQQSPGDMVDGGDYGRFLVERADQQRQHLADLLFQQAIHITESMVRTGF